MVKKISSDMYKCDESNEAIKQAELLSKIENDVFSIIYSKCGDDEKYYYYVERGDPFIRISETLIGIYFKGKKTK